MRKARASESLPRDGRMTVSAFECEGHSFVCSVSCRQMLICRPIPARACRQPVLRNPAAIALTVMSSARRNSGSSEPDRCRPRSSTCR